MTGPKCLFLFDKIVVPSTVLLYPTNKNNNQTRGSLRTADVFTVFATLPPECTVPLGTWNFRNCVEWKAPHVFEREFREEVFFFLSRQRCNFKDMLHGTIYTAKCFSTTQLCTRDPLETDVLHGTCFGATKEEKGTQKASRRKLTTRMLHETRNS